MQAYNKLTYLRELSKHKLRLLELWRTTIRDVKVSLGNTSKVLGVFFVTQFVQVNLFELPVCHLLLLKHYVIHTKYQLKTAQ